MSARPDWFNTVLWEAYRQKTDEVEQVPYEAERVEHMHEATQSWKFQAVETAIVRLKTYALPGPRLIVKIGWCPGCGRGWWAQESGVGFDALLDNSPAAVQARAEGKKPR